MKKGIAVFAAIILTLHMFVSCADNEPVGTDQTVPTLESTQQPSATELSDNLPEKDFGGRTYTILSYEEAEPYYEKADEMTGEVINDAVYNQQLAVEERFNIKIDVIIDKNLNSTVSKSISAGDNNFNITASHLINQSSVSLQNVYLNLYKIPYLDFDMPWWNKNVIDELTINGKVVLAYGDLAAERSITYTHTFIFNKNLAADYGIDNLYNLVREGKWTLDKMEEIIKGVSKDLNGDNILDENDMYGLLQSEAVTNIYREAFDQPVTSRDSDGYPVIALNTPKMADIVSRVYNLCFNSVPVLTLPHAKEKDLAKMFINGQSLLYSGFFCDADMLKEMEDDFGFLPFPKYNESQEKYLTTVRGDNCLLGVPITTLEEDYEFVGIITEALSAEGYKQVRPAVYDVMLKNKLARDADSIEMLDIITSGIVFDFGFCYNDSGAGFLLWNMMTAKSSDFTSYYESREQSFVKYYEKVIDIIKELDG